MTRTSRARPLIASCRPSPSTTTSQLRKEGRTPRCERGPGESRGLTHPRASLRKKSLEGYAYTWKLVVASVLSLPFELNFTSLAVQSAAPPCQDGVGPRVKIWPHR